jgi:hypothetical protein
MNDFLQPGMPNYESVRRIVTEFQDEREHIQNYVFNRARDQTPISRQFDIHSISLPDELPARFGIRYDPDTELECHIDYPGCNPSDHDKYWSLKQSGLNTWFLSKNEGKDKATEPFRRFLFKNPYEAVKAVFDEFMVNSSNFIQRKADYNQGSS